ncbi:hypothetical protein Syun_013652 [Stephania yunnanensis]|uniref:Inositol polyphosphate-related phosphatase domain-containing protein n=1 Tax=Stephania yunnanensis TaxID=152371 RepID=A0AAP0JI06_9MAGN
MSSKPDRSCTTSDMTKPKTPEHNFVKNDKKKKSIVKKIFSSKHKNGRSPDEVVIDLERRIASRKAASTTTMRKTLSEKETKNSSIEGLNLSTFERPMIPIVEVDDFRIFVSTWNVGGKTPNNSLNLEDFLQVEGSADIYVLGFQEIVPLNAGNVLVLEDSEPAAKWLAIINQALNSPQDLDGSASDSSSGHASARPSSKDYNKSQGSLHFFQKPSLKVLSKNFRANENLVKSCNCDTDSLGMDRTGRRQLGQLARRVKSQYHHLDENEFQEENIYSIAGIPSQCKMNYRLVASKQMVGLFLSVWVRNELVQHVGHVRISSLGRGIMGYLGNKGCIAVSMSLHKTTFCFICSHLASGEKEGDELRRNSDVTEILKNTQFPRVCKHPWHEMPENIVNHDRVIWLGDLNYRVSLSYDEARVLLEVNNWDALLERDQLNIERRAGRVFKGWKEGQIFFAPTYKYSHNSDCYAGETAKSKKKRRTPAWCDRILWHGNGIEQLFYTRGESRFSDHRPVCAVFVAEVELRRRKTKNKLRKGLTAACSRMDIDDCIPQRHSLYEF